MIGGMQNGASGAQIPMSMVASTAKNFYNGTITMPSGIDSGDIIFVSQVARRASSSPASGSGTGFTSIYDVASSSASSYQRTSISYKVSAGSDSSASISGFINAASPSESEQAGIMVLRPYFTTSPTVTVGGITVSGFTTGTPSDITVPSSESGKPRLVIANQFVYQRTANLDVTTVPVFQYQRFRSALNEGTLMRGIWQGVGGGDLVASCSDVGGNNALVGFYMEIE